MLLHFDADNPSFISIQYIDIQSMLSTFSTKYLLLTL